METAAVQCTCCGHGETYHSPGDVPSRHMAASSCPHPAPGEFSGNAELRLPGAP